MTDAPDVIRRQPPRSTLAWVAKHAPSGRVVRVRRLRGAWANAIHAVDVTDRTGGRHEWVLRRWVRPEFAHEAAVSIPAEATALRLAHGAGIAPDVVATDVDATECDVPTLLMTRLPGAPNEGATFLAAHVEQIAEWLARTHDLAIDPGLPAYAPWYALDAVPPSWSQTPLAWAAGIEALQDFDAPETATLLHRDYHPGNFLWQGARMTAVVDWVNACRGPYEADLAACRRNLVALCDVATADAFLGHYQAITGRNSDRQPWFDLGAAVDVLPGPMDAWPYAERGRPDLDVDRLSAALDDFMVDAVNRL